MELTSALLPGQQLHDYLADPAQHAAADLLGIPVRLVTRWADVKDFVTDEDAFPGGASYRVNIEPVVGRTFISMDGEEHLQVRKLAMPAFQSKPVTRFVESDLVPLAHEVVDRFAARGEADLVAEVAHVLPFLAISRKLGLPQPSERQQRAIARSLLTHLTTPDVAARAADSVTELVQPLLDERRAEPRPDVLSHLLGTGLTDEEVVSHVRLLYAVGANTVSDMMGNLLGLVLGDEDLLDRARHDPASRPALVGECLRYEPAVALLPRVAAHGGTVAGEEVAPGTLVVAALAAANRDPDVFDRPHVLDPDRSETELMSFGQGPKFCPGWNLARAELLAALEVVIDRLPGLRCVDATEPEGAILRQTRSVRVRWDPRAS
jgi:cytochrome P450